MEQRKGSNNGRRNKHLNWEERYSATRGQTVYKECMRSKGRKPKLTPALAGHLKEHIVEHRRSPEVAAALMKTHGFEHAICFKTIYYPPPY